MPTGKIDLPWLAARMTENDLATLADLIRRKPDPRAAKLQKRRDKLKAEIAAIDAKIAAFTGGSPANPVRAHSGHKASAKPRGRPTKVKTVATSNHTGRPLEQQAAINNERIAKARAARAGKREAKT